MKILFIGPKEKFKRLEAGTKKVGHYTRRIKNPAHITKTETTDNTTDIAVVYYDDARIGAVETACATLKNDNSHTLIIAITSKNCPELRTQALNEGADACPYEDINIIKIEGLLTEIGLASRNFNLPDIPYYTDDLLTLDIKNNKATITGTEEELDLTSSQFALLFKTVTLPRMLDFGLYCEVKNHFDQNLKTSHFLNSTVNRIRATLDFAIVSASIERPEILELDPEDIIENVKGVGYVYTPPSLPQ